MEDFVFYTENIKLIAQVKSKLGLLHYKTFHLLFVVVRIPKKLKVCDSFRLNITKTAYHVLGESNGSLPPGL